LKVRFIKMLNNILNTPCNFRTLAIYSILVFLGSPFVVAFHYFTRWQRGDYPSEADTIGIPILGYVLFYLPLFLIILCAGLRKYPGRVPVYAWNRKCPIWSIWWTLLFLILAYLSILMIAEGFQGHLFLTAIFFIIQLHVLLLLRSSAVSRV